jgi:hypothetical protein
VGNRPLGGYVGNSRQPDRQHSSEFLSPKTKKRWCCRGEACPRPEGAGNALMIYRNEVFLPVESPIHFSHHWGRGQASPLQHWAFWFYRCVFRPHCFRLASLAENAIHQEIPAVGCPPYVCRHILAFLPNSFGFLMHRGGRDARVPVRAASRRLSAKPTFDVLVNRCVFPLSLSASDNDSLAT